MIFLALNLFHKFNILQFNNLSFNSLFNRLLFSNLYNKIQMPLIWVSPLTLLSASHK